MPEPKTRIAPWEDFVLRLIGAYKLAKAVLAFALGFEFLRFMHDDVAEFLRIYVIAPYRFDPENRFLKYLLDEASRLTPHKLELFSIGAFFYGTVFAAEGIGLYLRKHWAEYMVLFSTGLPLPIEIWEFHRKLAWWKFGIVFGNLLIIVYLVHRLILDARFKAQQRAAGEASPSDGFRGSTKEGGKSTSTDSADAEPVATKAP